MDAGLIPLFLDMPDVPIITNPPWTSDILHPMVSAWLTTGRTVWVLLAGTVLFNANWRPFAGKVQKIVPAGRPKWIEGSKHTAKDDAVWLKLHADARNETLAPRLTAKELKGLDHPGMRKNC